MRRMHLALGAIVAAALYVMLSTVTFAADLHVQKFTYSAGDSIGGTAADTLGTPSILIRGTSMVVITVRCSLGVTGAALGTASDSLDLAQIMFSNDNKNWSVRNLAAVGVISLADTVGYVTILTTDLVNSPLSSPITGRAVANGGGKQVVLVPYAKVQTAEIAPVVPWITPRYMRVLLRNQSRLAGGNLAVTAKAAMRNLRVEIETYTERN